MPSSPTPNCWCTFSATWRLLSHRKNSAAQNYDFEKKKTKYFVSRGKVSPFALTTQVLNEAQWTPDVIPRRQADLLGRLQRLSRL